MSQQPVTSPAGPWLSIVYLEMTFPNGATRVGSGVMVGPNDVLTAGHVVYSARNGGAATSVTVTPAYDPATGTGPLGSVEACGWHYLPGFDPDGDGRVSPGNGGEGLEGAERDIALVDLGVPLGRQTGWMGLDPVFRAGTVNVTGYPDARGNALMNEIGHVQDDATDWFVSTRGLEISAGNSGGPLWYLGADGFGHVVGIVSTASAACDVAGAFGTILGWMAGNDGLLAGA